MFKIESYVTPIILNYVTRYVKNIRPEDSQVSLWEGEVAFQNLDLRLDVLEEELNSPFEFLSGHIHELTIHVPWTKITSEPIRIVINTIEFVLKLKGNHKDGGNSSTSSSPQRNHCESQKRKRNQKADEQLQVSGSGLINKIINNISIECHNIILKYVEEDIVVSMNVQLLSFSSADENWKAAVVDVHPTKILMRKLVQISDLTICLDKRNAAGQIDVCQEPILYRCTLECRIFRKYNLNTAATTSSTRIGLFTKSMDMNISSLQFPMVMRLIKLVEALKSGSLKKHLDSEFCDEEQDDQSNSTQGEESFFSWAWSMIPNFTFEYPEEDDSETTDQIGHTMDFGIYLEQLNCTLKNSEFIMDSIMGVAKRIRYTPILRISLGALYFESVRSEERNWSSLKTGLSSIYIEPLGPYMTEDKSEYALLETSRVESARHFIDKSLFDSSCINADRGWSVTSSEEYFTRITDEYLLYRSPVLAIDVVQYKMCRPEDLVPTTSGYHTVSRSHDICMQYRLLSSGITLRYNHTFLQVKNIISDFIDSYDYPAYHAETVIVTPPAGQHVTTQKLHPPLVEDYDALMQYIPRCTYRFDFKDIKFEMYAKCESDCQKFIRRLPTKEHIPFFRIHFENMEGCLTTSLQPDKLVHTTCQLPDKPQLLMDACYDNYKFNLKDLSVSLVNKDLKRISKVLHVPKLKCYYGKLLQPHCWTHDDIATKKFNLNCEQLILDFTKREFILSQRLLSSILYYDPTALLRLARESSRPMVFSDTIKLQSHFNDVTINLKDHVQYISGNMQLGSLLSNVIYHTAFETIKHIFFSTSTSKLQNEKRKWLDCQVIWPHGEPPSDQSFLSVIVVSIEKFQMSIDNNLVEFLNYYVDLEGTSDRESVVEIELNTQTLQQPQSNSTVSNVNNANVVSANSFHSQNPRRGSRNPFMSRKVSQPEETIHFSSERDEKVEVGSTVESTQHSPKVVEYTAWLQLVKNLVISIEIAKGKLNIADNFQRNEHGSIVSQHLQIYLPKLTLKSPHSDVISVSNIVQRLNTANVIKDTMNWTIALQDLNVQYFSTGMYECILSPIHTTITIALTHKKEKMKNAQLGDGLITISDKKVERTKGTDYAGPSMRRQSAELEANNSTETQSSNSLANEISSDELLLFPSNAINVLKMEREKEKEKNVVTKDVITLTLHADTTPIHFHFLTRKIKIIQQKMNVLLRILHHMKATTKRKVNLSNDGIISCIEIITPTEENSNIKEFMDLETNTESSMSSDDKNVTLVALLLFCQWSIARIIVDLKSEESSKHNKVILELEDLLSTVDKREDFIKYTSKMGSFNLNYYEPNAKGEWTPQECLRIKMLGETTNLPFFNLIVTRVGLKNFYKRINAKRKGDVNRNISEILITMQAIEMILDLHRVGDFVGPLCALFEKSDNRETQQIKKNVDLVNPMTAADLPLIYLDSKGFTLYMPLEVGKASCSVVIWRIENIKVTPKLDNPLQRNPIRVDVYNKAGQMGILTTPGSIIEDRQYELTLRHISAATGNWEEILTHMRDQSDNFHRTNPAFEWNNQNRKTSLQLTDIFSNFKFMAIYAPCIVYNKVLICGEAIEFNCGSDFVATINTYQISLLSCLILRLQHLFCVVCDSCNRSSNTMEYSTSTSFNEDSKLMKSSQHISSQQISSQTRSFRSVTSLQCSTSHNRRKPVFIDAHSNSSVFQAIDEDAECNINTDSGFQSIPSIERYNLLNYSNDRFTSIPPNSASVLQSRGNENTQAHQKTIPHTVSIVAGVFVIKILNVEIDKDDANVLNMTPLMCFTFSQPSFMFTQGIYDSQIHISLFNMIIAMSGTVDSTDSNVNLFPEIVLSTGPGTLTPTGIPPSLFSLKSMRTKMQLLEVDMEVAKPILISINEKHIKRLWCSILLVYGVLLENPCFDIRPKRNIVRGSKIKLMRQQFFNADRLHLKCEKMEVKFLNGGLYKCKMVCCDYKLNVKFLNRPEKATVNASIGSLYLRTDKKIFVHPIAVRMCADFVSEPWHRLPLVIATVKFNVVHLDLGIYVLLKLRNAVDGIQRLLEFFNMEWRKFLRNRPFDKSDDVPQERLLPLKCRVLEKSNNATKSGRICIQREEFYQDDLRAGAFQFVDMLSDSFLPLPYQIQIIKKHFGIICWRYPQARKMSKIFIFPVPLPVANPIHIKCRMEYFSETHECFLHYCDFWLSETVSKEITLPEREVCANIWRVVILQSLVSVNGECFDNSEEDDELLAIPNCKIDEIFNKDMAQNDFLLHPKLLVGCMRIDTSFQSECVPKLQLLVSCNALLVKFLNQPNQCSELPSLLKKFKLVDTTEISQTFLMILLEKINFHASMQSRGHYTIDNSMIVSVKCVGYGFLNMMRLVEPTNLQANVHVNKTKRLMNVNISFDRLRINVGPSVMHTLISSKTHWEELLDLDPKRKRHALIPKFIVVNRTMSNMSFGQTGTTERIHLQPKECYMYSFCSDYHNQELTFFIADNDTQITEASQSVSIVLKFEGSTMLQSIRIGNKVLIIKSQKLSATQIFILVKGQIEFLSMMPQELRLEFRRVEKKPEFKNIEYTIEQKDRSSFYWDVHRNENIFMRLRLGKEKGRGRTGDIPLKTNKNLPWLVKVPNMNNEFISVWVRVLREDIPNFNGGSKFQPQKILITVWPIFVVSSMLCCPVNAEENTSSDKFQLEAAGGQHVLNVPATHLTEHRVSFEYDVPIADSSPKEFTLALQKIDWNKFFWYDEKLWTIEHALETISNDRTIKWPLKDEEEQRIKRSSHHASVVTNINYAIQPSREFSCTLELELSSWGMFINGSGLVIGVQQSVSKERIIIASNSVEMMCSIPQSFTLDIIHDSSWISSQPFYFDSQSILAGSGKNYTLLDDCTPRDVVILRNEEVIKLVIEQRCEYDRRIFKLRPKYVVTNLSKKNLCILPFAMDHKETASRAELAALHKNTSAQCIVNATNDVENCIGKTIDCFIDINSRKAIRTNDTAFVYFVSLRLSEDLDFSIPIPLTISFTRRCFSIQNGDESIPLMATLIEKDSTYYLTIFEDLSPTILISNQTDVKLIIGQTSASEHNKVTSTTPEYDGRHFEWFQFVAAHSKCYYTPPEMYTNFPDVESTTCNLTLALYKEYCNKSNIKWSKPLRTDKTWEKFLQIPNHGDVKVMICDKHRIIRVSIFYIAQQLEFSVKDLRSRLLMPHNICDVETSDNSIITLLKQPSDITELLIAPPTKCSHFLDECDCKMQMNIRFFIKDTIVSLHTDSKERDCMKSEIFGLYMDDFMLAYDDDDIRRELNVLIPNLQIDNQLYCTGKYDFPVVLCSQKHYKRSAIVPQVHYLERVYQQLKSEEPMGLFTLNFFDDELKISAIVCSFSPLRAYIEDAYVNDLLEALVECEPSNCVYKPKFEKPKVVMVQGQYLLPRDVIAQALCVAEPFQLRSFRIEQFNVLLSVHTSVRLYIALDHSPLSFSTYERHQVLTMPLRFGQSLGMHYLSGAIFGAGWVVGSLEILGSPSGLARSFSTGLRDFVSMPVQGLFRGPWGFVVGITQGSASLLRNVTAGTVNSVTKLAASVARNLDRLTLDEEHIERTEALRRSRPQGFTQGFSQGITGLGISILGAVGGIARHTLEARSAVGLVTGMGKGFVGAFTKPISGAAELIALAGQGMLHTVGFNTMPQQRVVNVCYNLSVEPSSYRIWKLLPGVLMSDQLLFYHEVTLVVKDQLRKAFVFLTSAVFVIMEAQWDKLEFVYPINKVEAVSDPADKTLVYVRLTKEKEDLEEDISYTNQRIMSFLVSSYNTNTPMTSDSLNDLLRNTNSSACKDLDWSFYISEHWAEFLIQYLKILKAQ